MDASRISSIVFMCLHHPYMAPQCRVQALDLDQNFLASGDFGQGGYPGDDLEPGDEYDF